MHPQLRRAPAAGVVSASGRAPGLLNRARRFMHLLMAASVAFSSLHAGAQVLSSPLGAPPSGNSGAATAAGVPGVPAGQGAGYHSPDSPFAPLNPREDVLPWSVLTAVKTKTEKNRILPVFDPVQLALNQKTQRIQGFMMPLEPGERQRHFLLSSVPLTCAFCVPGGPESMVEVRTSTPVKYSMEVVVVEGRFQVLKDDAYGLYYRMTDAASVK
ncbi:MAG: DUF3299 domain-containing protein [Polaromonas sp.]|nr:DUF3299 domain-containing protein [Polaromonas sp.]